MMTKADGAPFIHSVGDAPAVSSVDTTALYRPADGEVIHMHHAVTLEGARRQPPEAQEANAREAARRLGCDVDGLAALHVADFYSTGQPYRVDSERRTLVEAPAAQRTRRSGSG